MGLQAMVKSAVKTASKALDDLAIDSKLIRRTVGAYVPGGDVNYTESQSDIRIVVTRFAFKEIDGERIRAEDSKIIIFSESVIPEPNDVIQLDARRWRVIAIEPVHAGSEIIFSTVQARPLSA